MKSPSEPKIDASTDLGRLINWNVRLPDYMFNNSALSGFFVIDSGVLTTRGFLDFVLNANADENNQALTILVRTNEHAPRDLVFIADNIDEIKNARIYLMQNLPELFGSIVAVSSAPSKWIAYEETAEDFSVLAIFDDETWKRWSSKDSGIHDYVIGEDQISTKLLADGWPGWESDFLKEFLTSFGQAKKS